MKVTTGRGDEGKVAYFHVHAKREKVYYFLPHSRSERESAWRRIFSFRNLFSICFVRVRDATKSVLQLHVERQQVQFFMSCIFSRFRCHLLQLVSLVFVSSKAHDSWWRYWCRLFFLLFAFVMASSPSPSSLDSVGTSPLGSFSDPNEHPLLARDLGLGPLVGYGDSGVFNGINSTAFSSCSSMLHNSALSLYLNGLGSSGNLDSGSALKVFIHQRYFFDMLAHKPIVDEGRQHYSWLTRIVTVDVLFLISFPIWLVTFVGLSVALYKPFCFVSFSL